MENWKNVVKKLKKSEIAIYAIAIMLVAAGYFNYTTFDSQTEETYSEDIEELTGEYANVGDAVLVSSNEIEEEQEEVITDVEEQQIEEEIDADEEEQLTETTDTSVETDYYVSSKLERDQMYAEMISNYEAILNNINVSEAQKSIATQEITEINNTKNAIMICENLILTKGFENCLILANDESINIVVSIEGGLTTDGVAKIQNIVSRELGCDIENIHITEK